MDVVWARLCFYYFYALLQAQFAQYYSYVLFYFSVNFHVNQKTGTPADAPVRWRKISGFFPPWLPLWGSCRRKPTDTKTC